MIIKRPVFFCILALVLIFGWAMPLSAEQQRPLLMPGKSSLYQRVLARPEAMLHAAAGSSRALQEIKPFTVFYIYGERKVGGNEWIKVGTDSHGNTQGWVLKKQLIPWNQVLTVAFRNPAMQNRVLLFKERDELKKLIQSNNQSNYQQLYQRAVAGTLDNSSPVIAIQPEHHIDIQEDFYLVPIQQHEDVYLGNEQAMMLQVTTVPLKEGQPSTQKPKMEAIAKPNSSSPQKSKRFRSGLVFVTDATNSMGPYINRTREAVRKVYKSIERAGLNNDVRARST